MNMMSSVVNTFFPLGFSPHEEFSGNRNYRCEKSRRNTWLDIVVVYILVKYMIKGIEYRFSAYSPGTDLESTSMKYVCQGPNFNIPSIIDHEILAINVDCRPTSWVFQNVHWVIPRSEWDKRRLEGNQTMSCTILRNSCQ